MTERNDSTSDSRQLGSAILRQTDSGFRLTDGAIEHRGAFYRSRTECNKSTLYQPIRHTGMTRGELHWLIGGPSHVYVKGKAGRDREAVANLCDHLAYALPTGDGNLHLSVATPHPPHPPRPNLPTGR